MTRAEGALSLSEAQADKQRMPDAKRPASASSSLVSSTIGSLRLYKSRGLFIGSMSIVGVEQKEEPKKRSSVERHITPFIRRHEAE